MRLKTLILMGFLIFGFSAPAYAGPFDRAQSKLKTAVNGTELPSDLGETIGMIVKALLSLVGTIFLLLTIYAGILWMTAQGNEEKVSKAKDIVQAAVIGLVITMSAYAITAFVTTKVGQAGDPAAQVGDCSQMGGVCTSVCSAGQTEVSGTSECAGELCCY